MIYSRPILDEYFLAMAKLVALRGTCRRRQVGCILVSDRRHVLATGYNGRPMEMPHCLEHPCHGLVADVTSGTALDQCEAVHAEQNALLQCHDVFQIATCYTTVSPCLHCVKMLMNTSCRGLVFLKPYAQAEEARMLWEGVGRSWRQVTLDIEIDINPGRTGADDNKV